jgi:2-polyprenyl-3-methyl-5-hydroxy-6-metoxy-1,4-benzoquinol methylase
MNEDTVEFKHFPGDEGIARRVRIKLQKILYWALTGYWNTGERLHPLFVTNNYVNHLRVYQFVSQFVKGKQILDVGCGVGYGTALLGRNASRAVGIDLSEDTIYEAFRLYPEGEFLQMDAENMTFPAEAFDAIISTENFEHLPNQAKHARELARVIRKNGLCFIATPNPELFVGEVNPFHTKENTYEELMALLSACFREVEIIEPTRIPANPVGRASREERFSRGAHGKIVGPHLEIFGINVDQTFLSNTHSFNCFARDPIT